MKRICLFTMILLVSASLAGCGNGLDFQGAIYGIKKASILVATDDVDPEASYPEYQVFINNKTKINGAVDEFSKLKINQKVKIWVVGEWNNDSENKMVANKIVVSKK